MNFTKNIISRLLLFSGFSFAIAALLFVAGFSKIFFVLFAAIGIVFSAFAFNKSEKFKGLTYPLMIIASVVIAMAYPDIFVSIRGFHLAVLITPLLQIIMFGMGTTMSVQDFVGVVKMPKGVIIGAVCQFSIMPLIGFSLASIFNFPPEIAAGIILIGSSPGGMASNVMAYLARANVALSITLTTVSTLLAPFLTPFWMRAIGSQFIEIDAFKMMLDIIKIVIIPVVGGVLFNHLFKGKTKWIDVVMPRLSMGSIAFIIVIITAIGRDSLMEIGILLFFTALIHNILGYFVGYSVGRLFKMNEKDCRTIAIEVGMQNGGLASGIAKEMGKVATVGLAPAIFGPAMNITGSLLASFWRGKIPSNLKNVKLNILSNKY